jgi:hypothetical protein
VRHLTLSFFADLPSALRPPPNANVSVCQDTLVKHDKPEIFNTDQDSHFTGAAFTVCSLTPALRSAWTARGPGVTTHGRPAPCLAHNGKRADLWVVVGPLTLTTFGTLSRIGFAHWTTVLSMAHGSLRRVGTLTGPGLQTAMWQCAHECQEAAVAGSVSV